jgi:predicted small integral membrane protein
VSAVRSRRAARIAEAVARGSIVVGVLIILVGGVRRQYVLGPIRAPATELFFTCIFLSLAGLVVWLLVTPREVWREDGALMASRGGRVVRFLPLIFIAISISQDCSGDRRERVAIGPIRTTRGEISSRSMLIALACMTLVEPLYRSVRASRLKRHGRAH